MVAGEINLVYLDLVLFDHFTQSNSQDAKLTFLTLTLRKVLSTFYGHSSRSFAVAE